jgi:anthranilate/para-aminobenzoate synthase component I
MDLNILIRSLVIHKGRAYLQVGAGIVADSQPKKEYDETLYKAEAVLNALFGKEGADRFLRSRGITRGVS